MATETDQPVYPVNARVRLRAPTARERARLSLGTLERYLETMRWHAVLFRHSIVKYSGPSVPYTEATPRVYRGPEAPVFEAFRLGTMRRLRLPNQMTWQMFFDRKESDINRHVELRRPPRWRESLRHMPPPRQQLGAIDAAVQTIREAQREYLIAPENEPV